MAYGIEILNDSGFTQVDQNYANLLVVASGTCDNGAIINFPNSYTGDNIYIFAKPADTSTTDNYVYGYIDRINSRFRLYRSQYTQNNGSATGAWLENFVTTTGYDTTDLIDYVVCYEPSDIPDPSDPYGLEVLAADGSVLFSASHPVMQITHIQQFETGPSTTFYASGIDIVVAAPLDIANVYSLINCTTFFFSTAVGISRLRLRFSAVPKYDYANNTITLETQRTGSGPTNSGLAFAGHGESQRTLLLGTYST